jgi:hypothetical protein
MDSMIYAIHASSLMRASTDGTPPTRRTPEELYDAPHHGLRDTLHLAAALGGLLLYAGVLAFAWQ